jgi:hypothetical protein
MQFASVGDLKNVRLPEGIPSFPADRQGAA